MFVLVYFYKILVPYLRWRKPFYVVCWACAQCWSRCRLSANKEKEHIEKLTR